MTTSNAADGRTPRRPSTPSTANTAARWSASGRGRRRPAAMPAARSVTPGFRARRISGELENRPETGRLGRRNGHRGRCKRCGLARYETQAKLIAEPGFRNFYLDEVEYSLCCSDRFCRGGVRISLTHDDRNEGFVGG